MNVLFVKTSSLGDIAQTLQLADWVKNQIPEAKVHWVVEKPFSSIFEAFPSVDETLLIDTKKWRKNPFSLSTYKELKSFIGLLRGTFYDVLFDLQGNSKSAFITSFARAGNKVGFGWKTAQEFLNPLCTGMRFDPPSYFSPKERSFYLLTSYFGSNDAALLPASLNLRSPPFLPLGSPAILLFPSSNWQNKTLSTLQLQTFLLEAKEKHPKMECTLFWGTEKEQMWCEEIKEGFSYCHAASRRYSPAELLSLMEKSDLILSADSFALHLAAHTQTPLLSFFGPSNGGLYAPSGEKSAYFQGACPYGVVFEKRCPHLRTCKTGACLKETSSSELLQKLSSLLK